jgi:hypothetical protein
LPSKRKTNRGKAYKRRQENSLTGGGKRLAKNKLSLGILSSVSGNQTFISAGLEILNPNKISNPMGLPQLTWLDPFRVPNFKPTNSRNEKRAKVFFF